RSGFRTMWHEEIAAAHLCRDPSEFGKGDAVPALGIGEFMATSTSQPIQSLPTLPTQPFRLDVPLHNLLQKPPDPSPPPARVEHEPGTSLALPSPVFPQHPALMHELDAADISEHDTVLQTGKRHWPAS